MQPEIQVEQVARPAIKSVRPYTQILMLGNRGSEGLSFKFAMTLPSAYPDEWIRYRDQLSQPKSEDSVYAGFTGFYELGAPLTEAVYADLEARGFMRETDGSISVTVEGPEYRNANDRINSNVSYRKAIELKIQADGSYESAYSTISTIRETYSAK